MHPRHAMSATALLLAAGLGAWFLLADAPVETAESSTPLPLPPIPPRIASGQEYDRCLGLLTTEPESAATRRTARALPGATAIASSTHPPPRSP